MAGDHDLHPRWRTWASENLARGAGVAEVVDALVAEGVPRADAEAIVAEMVQPPTDPELQRWWRRTRALEQLVRLRAELRRAAPPELRRGPLPAQGEFLAQHWIPGVPLVVTDLVPRWPAFARWEPAELAARFGDVEVGVCCGREGAADPDPDWKPLERRVRFAELLELVAAGDASNDVYMIAKNTAFCVNGLLPLQGDLVLPPDIFGPEVAPKRMGLWIGSAGTHTALHHDTDNSMFCQVRGRKRFRLAPPESLALFERSRGVFSHWDPRDDDALAHGPEELLELVIEAGEALFIPAGWWHQVDALSPSISVTVLQFAFPNDFSWYRPGSWLRGSVGYRG